MSHSHAGCGGGDLGGKCVLYQVLQPPLSDSMLVQTSGRQIPTHPVPGLTLQGNGTKHLPAALPPTLVPGRPVIFKGITTTAGGLEGACTEDGWEAHSCGVACQTHCGPASPGRGRPITAWRCSTVRALDPDLIFLLSCPEPLPLVESDSEPWAGQGSEASEGPRGTREVREAGPWVSPSLQALSACSISPTNITDKTQIKWYKDYSFQNDDCRPLNPKCRGLLMRNKWCICTGQRALSQPGWGPGFPAPWDQATCRHYLQVELTRGFKGRRQFSKGKTNALSVFSAFLPEKWSCPIIL